MSLADLLPYLNVLLIPVLGYVMRIENRVTRLEALEEADDKRRRRNPDTRS
ncbi:MAG: hypothetical protein U1E12_10190 [Hydrogenophaga sp.]|uniref:hypothetical protein n=1 Tax=Hydrogenophaga sp. TaxID=1904254 RepID=UPI002ABB8C1B|nr:hypothetical protein [Hydrogenophaga sp.]MDZ4102031.1 hypothetical protein [Hydrogenophaga sp.]